MRRLEGDGSSQCICSHFAGQLVKCFSIRLQHVIRNVSEMCTFGRILQPLATRQRPCEGYSDSADESDTSVHNNGERVRTNINPGSLCGPLSSHNL
jgi:hypothetical protein